LRFVVPISLLAMALTLCLGPAASGQGGAGFGGPGAQLLSSLQELQSEAEGPGNFPRLRLARFREAPVIDGRLDDAVWAEASVIDRLTQVVPVEGVAPTEATTVSIGYDDDHLYIGVRCHDSEPELIRATEMQRDGSLGSDDRIQLVIDTFFDRRNAFLFEVNAVGARTDGLVENSGSPNRQWDGIWYAQASIDEAGWSAELILPFKTMAFNPDSDRWGFNISRNVRRKNETSRWSTADQDSSLFQVGDAGIIENIREIKQGLGLDVRPFLTSRIRFDQENDNTDFDLEPGADIFYRVTPSLTAAFTVNTDFAEAEVDERQVNLTRVPLFFPERRDFFLQDAGIFGFGGIRSDPLPFFSRRIGLGANGQPVDIIAGLKLTGRVDDLNIGLLNVQLGESETAETENVSVARLAYNVLEESQVGVIATYGDPRSENDNALIGFDFNFRDSNVFGNQTVTASAWFQKTFTEGLDGDDHAWGVRAAFPNDTWDLSFGAAEVRANYNPGLGFTRRFGRSIREFFTSARYRIRPSNSVIRRIDFGVGAFAITDLDFVLETGNFRIDLIEIQNQIGDTVGVTFRHQGEFLPEPFQIFRGVTIDRGHYGANQWEFSFQSATARPFSVSADVGMGEFFDGTRLQLDLGVQWRPSRHLFMSLSYEENDVSLPAGNFSTRIVRARLNIFFTPDLSWNNFVQYDNVSDLLGINSRLRWIIEPGREFFFVINQGFLTDGDFRSAVTEVSAKLGWTFRF
jgi:uncharacterized protein DUF5916